MEPYLSPKGVETQRKIWIAASKVIARKGIENASVTEIAKMARITRSLIQYYLPKKNELMISLINFIAVEGYHYFQKRGPEIRCEHSMPEDLEIRIRLNFDFFSSHPHYFQCFMLFLYKTTYDTECRKLNTNIVTNATQAMSLALGTNEFSSDIYFGMHSAVQRCFIVDSGRNLDAAVEDFLLKVEEKLEFARSKTSSRKRKK